MHNTFYVVIPLYNMEKYISDCILSITDQGYQECKIIIVDDGSSDGGLNICKNHQKLYNNIVVLSKENNGPFSARQDAIKYILENEKNDGYVWFVDSDDLLGPDSLSRLNDIINESHTDVVAFNYEQTSGDASFGDNPISGMIDNKADIYKHCLLNNASGPLWRKVFSTKLLTLQDREDFCSLRISEDRLQGALLLEKADSVMFTHERLYIHRETPGSLTTFIDPGKVWNSVFVWSYILHTIEECNIWSEEYVAEYFQKYLGVLANHVSLLSNTNEANETKLTNLKLLRNDPFVERALSYNGKHNVLTALKRRRYKLVISVCVIKNRVRLFLKKLLFKK